MAPVVVALLLVAYNNVLNLWPPFHRWAFLPANLLAGALLLITALGPLGLDVSDIGVQRPGMLLTGASLGIVAATPLFVLLHTNFGLSILADRRFEDEEAWHLAFRMLVRVPVGTAAFEELAFRGVLLALWAPAGELDALFVSSAAFGLWHIAPTIYGLRVNRARVSFFKVAAAILLTMGAGLILGYLRITTGSLWAPFALHAVVNSLGTLAAAIANRASRLLS